MTIDNEIISSTIVLNFFQADLIVKMTGREIDKGNRLVITTKILLGHFGKVIFFFLQFDNVVVHAHNFLDFVFLLLVILVYCVV